MGLLRNAKAVECSLKVLLLIEVESSVLPLSCDSTAENLLNLPQVLGFEPSAKSQPEPIDVFLILSCIKQVR